MNTFFPKLLQRIVYRFVIVLAFLLPSTMLVAQTNCSNAIEIDEGYEANFSLSGNTSEFTEASTCGENSAYLVSGAVRVFKYTPTENVQSVEVHIKSDGHTGIGVFTDCTSNSLAGCIDYAYLDGESSGDMFVSSGVQSVGTDLYFVVGKDIGHRHDIGHIV